MRVWSRDGNMVCLDGTTAFWVNDDALLGPDFDDDVVVGDLAQFIVDACNEAERIAAMAEALPEVVSDARRHFHLAGNLGSAEA